MKIKSIWIAAFLLSALMTEAFSFTLKTEQWTTKNGAKVVFYQANEVPMLDVFVAFNAGSAYDGNHYGLSSLTAQLMSEGSGSLNANQCAEQVADTGAQLNIETSRHMSLLHLRTLTHEKALENASHLFKLMLTKPLFSSGAFYQEKSQLLASIAKTLESPDDIANIAFFNKLYANHPYAHPINGTEHSVKSIQPWQIRQFYKQYYVGSNAIIVMVGAISDEKAHELANQLTEQLPEGAPAPSIPDAKPLETAMTEDIQFPSSQSVLRLGQLGITHKNPAYFPLMVGNYILGGGLVSRLSQEIREKRGLSYNTSSELMPLPANGVFIISLSTKNKQRNQAIEITKKTLNDFINQGPTDKELADAKQYLIGNFALSLASNSSIAGMLVRLRFYDLPDNYLDTYIAQIENVTAEDVRNAFRTLIKPDQLLQVTVGKS